MNTLNPVTITGKTHEYVLITLPKDLAPDKLLVHLYPDKVAESILEGAVALSQCKLEKGEYKLPWSYFPRHTAAKEGLYEIKIWGLKEGCENSKPAVDQMYLNQADADEFNKNTEKAEQPPLPPAPAPKPAPGPKPEEANANDAITALTGVLKGFEQSQHRTAEALTKIGENQVEIVSLINRSNETIGAIGKTTGNIERSVKDLHTRVEKLEKAPERTEDTDTPATTGGSSVLKVIVAILIVAALGVLGWFLWKHKSAKTDPSAALASQIESNRIESAAQMAALSNLLAEAKAEPTAPATNSFGDIMLSGPVKSKIDPRHNSVGYQARQDGGGDLNIAGGSITVDRSVNIGNGGFWTGKRKPTVWIRIPANFPVSSLSNQFWTNIQVRADQTIGIITENPNVYVGPSMGSNIHNEYDIYVGDEVVGRKLQPGEATPPQNPYRQGEWRRVWVPKTHSHELKVLGLSIWKYTHPDRPVTVPSPAE